MASYVDYSNAFTEAWNNLKSLLDNRTNVPDPSMAPNSSVYRKFVYTRDPDLTEAGWEDFPYLVLPGVGVNNPTSGKQTLDSKKTEVVYTVSVEVVTCDRANNSADGLGAVHNDTIANAIYQTLNNSTNRDILRANGLYGLKLDATGAVPETFKDTLIYRRTVVISMTVALKAVSA